MAMRMRDIHEYALTTPIATSWHWLKWHLTAAPGQMPVPFGEGLLFALAVVDDAMPGYAKRMIDGLAAIHGREKDGADLDQIRQRLGELVVAFRLCSQPWPKATTFADEPAAPGSAKNPEMTVTTPGGTIGVEVKTPTLGDHARLRSSQSWQLSARVFGRDHVSGLEQSLGPITKPRDNPLKDFLLSANEKFAAFKTADAQFTGVLIIIWDDYVSDTWPALRHERVGLLTPNSWLRDGDEPVTFPNVDAVVVTGHQTMINIGLTEKPPFGFGERALHWEHPGMWAGVTYADNPHGGGLSEPFRAALGARELDPRLAQIDAINWFSRSPDSPLNRPTT